MEQYNLIHLHMESLSGKENIKLRGQGITQGQFASTYLKNKMCCRDPRIGFHNVLKLTHSALEFERIFVFYDDEKFNFKEHKNKLKHSIKH